MMLKVYVDEQFVGSLFKAKSKAKSGLKSAAKSEPEFDSGKHHFGYEAHCPLASAVSLSMPVVPEQYVSDYKALHPVFDMNLPEGALAERLRKEFSKVIPNFDALAMLKIVGKSQIGRLRFAAVGETLADMPAENLSELIAHDGADGLFESLLSRYAVHSGVSGAMPKVLVRDSALNVSSAPNVLSNFTHRGATHIVKAWTDEYPRLAENEYFCMRAALHAGLAVPQITLSAGAKFLAVERFDLTPNGYLGFEDFCVLNGKTAAQKYDGSYEGIVKRIKHFVSPEQVRTALEDFFKALALSYALKNGDAHLKNFGVLYSNTEATVRLAPIYDVVTTTVYIPADVPALTLNGTKRWPTAKALTTFARTHCNIPEARVGALLREVERGVLCAASEATSYIASNKAFEALGTAMLAQWREGLALSLR